MKTLLAVAIVMASVSYAQQDTVAYRAASALINANEKTKALEEFLVQYPSSMLKARVYDGLFDLYVDRRDESAAVEAASQSLATLAPESRMNPYNRFAYALALSNIGIDSALIWAARAEEIAQKSASRSLSGIQDTRAYVLYRKGKFGDAEALQRAAIKGHERDPEYISHLALYEKANGNILQALKTMSVALYFGGDPESKGLFLTWVGEAEKEKPKQEALKKSAVMSTIHSLIDTLKGGKLVSAKSNAAIVMAELGVDLPTAHKWSDAAVRTLNKNSSISDVISYNESLSLVLATEGKHKEALRYLQAIEDIVDPYDVKYWSVLGKTYEQMGENRKAALAYMNGLIPRNDAGLRSALESVYTKQQIPLADIDQTLDSLRKSSINFETGTYDKSESPNGKVVLAELFTGAECGPCVGSDMAFDALGERYPRSALAILEYHVHIPGPDPMTTDESWDRYKLYDGGGTPTVIVDGRESILGGGAKTVAKNRFGVYRYAIRKFESEKPRVKLSISAKDEKDNIVVDVEVSSATKPARLGKPVLHVALVERSVDYVGSNGIEKHAYVVRHMVGGAGGSVLSFKKPTEVVSAQINLEDVEKTIKEYLDSPTTQRSWSNRRPFTGWKARPEKLDRSQLAIVAWVQDMQTKEVFQAAYHDLLPAIGEK